MAPFRRCTGAGWNSRIEEPIHDRVRALFQPYFTPKAVAQDRLLIRGETDLVEKLAFPLPVRVVARKLGITIADIKDFPELMDEFIAFTGTVQNFHDQALAARDRMTEKLMGFFEIYHTAAQRATERPHLSHRPARG